MVVILSGGLRHRSKMTDACTGSPSANSEPITPKKSSPTFPNLFSPSAWILSGQILNRVMTKMDTALTAFWKALIEDALPVPNEVSTRDTKLPIQSKPLRKKVSSLYCRSRRELKYPTLS